MKTRSIETKTRAAIGVLSLLFTAGLIDLLAPYRTDMLGTGCEGTGQAVDARRSPAGWQIHGGPQPGWQPVPAARIVADWQNPTGFPLAWFDGDRLVCFAPPGGTA